MVKLALISDTHGYLPKIPECDIMVHAGDLCPVYNHELNFQELWLHTNFQKWLDNVPSKYNVFVPGNHDYLFQRRPKRIPFEWLKDSGERDYCLIARDITVEGIKFWGSPYQPWFLDWAFNAPKGDVEEEYLTEKFSNIPAGTDVIINHGPPYGFGDKTLDGHLTGSKALLERIEAIQPKYVITGHIHCAVGSYTIGKTTVLNVSYLGEDYKPYGTPILTLDF